MIPESFMLDWKVMKLDLEGCQAARILLWVRLPTHYTFDITRPNTAVYRSATPYAARTQ